MNLNDVYFGVKKKHLKSMQFFFAIDIFIECFEDLSYVWI